MKAKENIHYSTMGQTLMFDMLNLFEKKGGTGVPGGLNNSIQYNKGGVFGGFGSYDLINDITTINKLSDNLSNLSIDVFNRQLVNTSGTIILDWNNEISFDGNLIINGGLSFNGEISHTLTSNTNNLTITGLNDVILLRLSSSGNYSLTGILAPNPLSNQLLIVINVGTNNISMKDNSPLSLSENRFLLGADKTIQSNEALTLVYDQTSLKWRGTSINI